MIYAEGFRHFVEEWIEINHPKRYRNCPWENNDLFLVNLYPTSAPVYFTMEKMPVPFVSILLDANFVRENALITEDRILYRGHFENGSFMLPRRYMLKGITNSGATFSFNRYQFTSEGYGDLASSGKDSILLAFMATHPHVFRDHSEPKYEYLSNRLSSLGKRENIQYHMANILLDFTEIGVKDLEDFEWKKAYSRESVASVFPLVIIQTPIVSGITPFLKNRGKDWSVLKDFFVSTKEKVAITIPSEFCHSEFDKVRNPFHQRRNKVKSMTDLETTGDFAYILGRFRDRFTSLIENNNAVKIELGGVTYSRVIAHTFSLTPRVAGDGTTYPGLEHKITESLLRV